MIATIESKRDEYTQYINTHMENVKKAWAIFQKKCGFYLDMQLLGDISLLIDKHDESKFSDEEFEAYRKYFYPITDAEKNDPKTKVAFDLAWGHHYRNNPHHWDYWYHGGIVNEMKYKYVVEMVCDWLAMGMKEGSQQIDSWYEDNKSKIVLSNENRKLVEVFIANLIKE